MIETVWTILPFPYNELAQPLPLRALETPCLLDALIATGAALAGVLAAAARDWEVDQEDIRVTLRLLAEHLHSTAALWHEWREHEEPDEATEA
jgi:hypothetical protein